MAKAGSTAREYGRTVMNWARAYVCALVAPAILVLLSACGGQGQATSGTQSAAGASAPGTPTSPLASGTPAGSSGGDPAETPRVLSAYIGNCGPARVYD